VRKNDDEFDVYTKMVEGRDVQELVEVYVTHGIDVPFEVGVGSDETCCTRVE